MYYVEINNNKITGKAQINIDIELQENQFEVTEEIYNALVRMPADFETDEEGNIISVTVPEIPLEEVKQQKIKELDTARDTAIQEGFTSSVTGQELVFGYTEKDQLNILKQTNILTLNPSIDTIMWNTKDGQIVTLTRQQFIDMLNDIQNHENTIWTKYRELATQVEAATTVEEINSIVW
jgi:hypothetical protein